MSRTPGRTREINFFRVNNAFVLVDLPGYGYARISKEKKAEWRPLIESYLRRTTQLRGIVLLLDIRREPSEDDRAMLDFLAELEVPTIVALTKTDKLSKAGGTRARRVRSPAHWRSSTEQMIPFSAQTGEGRVELLRGDHALVGVGAVTSRPRLVCNRRRRSLLSAACARRNIDRRRPASGLRSDRGRYHGPAPMCRSDSAPSGRTTSRSGWSFRD